MKNSDDTIGNRTRDLPARSAVPQPTAPPRASAPVPSDMKIRRGGSVIVGICQDGRTDMQSNVVVLMSSFMELHVVNSRNDSPENICTIVSYRVFNVCWD